jgi:hypothetical protein
MRTDLRTNFYESQEHLRASLSRQSLDHLSQVVPQELRRSHGKGAKEEIVECLLKPKLTFHGTRSSAIPSIVRYSFMKPGDKHPKTAEEIDVRCGNTYGKGIYSSPDPNFTMAYSEFDVHSTRSEEIPGFKLIVCAFLMGSAATVFREDNWRDQIHPYPGADAHVGNSGLEYIVSSAVRILPVMLPISIGAMRRFAHSSEYNSAPTTVEKSQRIPGLPWCWRLVIQNDSKRSD